jgi:hypothetical protein
MKKGIDKRKRIFDKYVHQLKLMNDYHLIVDFVHYQEDCYVCPICLNLFFEKDLLEEATNMLTLEDAPPKSLGGRANTLTCKTCNSRCGHDIDFHLSERLIELDVRAFKPNIVTKAKFIHNGLKVQGELKIDSNGKMIVIHDKRNNNPESLEEYIKTTRKNKVVDVEFKPSRVDKHRLEVALLKTAYILAFEQYGYTLILSSPFNIVREQLKNPDQELYPDGFWTKQSSFKKEHEGVHLITSQGFEGFCAIFPLKTTTSESRFAVYLPVSEKHTHEIIARLKKQETGFGVVMESYMSNNYFEETGNMVQMVKFIESSNIN